MPPYNWLEIERATMAAWPALTTERYDGWVLRFARGYTRRANSINPLGASTLPLADKVDHCLARYSEAGIEPVFRLIDRGPASDVDDWLAQHGWERRDPTLVMWRALGPDMARLLPRPDLRALPLDAWLAAYTAISNDGRDQSAHREILQRIGEQGARLSLWRDEQPVACALAVYSGRFVVLIDVAVHPTWRRQGLGRALVQQSLAWGRARGAEAAVLQVVTANAGARALYAQAGFAPAYEYWYRHQA